MPRNIPARRPLAAAGDSNPTNGTCRLCSAPTGGVLCAGCVTVPAATRALLPLVAAR